MKIVVKAESSDDVNLEALRSEVIRLLQEKFGLQIRRVKVKS